LGTEVGDSTVGFMNQTTIKKKLCNQSYKSCPIWWYDYLPDKTSKMRTWRKLGMESCSSY